MSDPLSVASSVIGIVSLGLTVTSGLLQYYSAWKDFDDDVKKTFALIQTLKDLLNAAQSMTSSLGARKHSTAQDRAFTLIRTAQDSLLELQRRWEKLKAREPKSDAEIKHEALSRLENHRKRLLYPLRQGTLGKLRYSALEAQDLVTRALQLLNMLAHLPCHSLPYIAYR
jgi:hypothetical protein